MKDLEEKVRAMKVVEPSAGLDRRIERLFSRSERSVRRMPIVRRHVPLWACTAACVVALFTGVLLGRSTAPTDPGPRGSVSLFYVVDGRDQVNGNLFDWTDQEDHFLESASSVKIHVASAQDPKSG